MGLANDSIDVTPGTGATVATHLAGSKEHQAVVVAGPSGHIYGSTPTWIVQTGNTANVGAASTVHIDLFNASGSGVVLEVYGVFIIPTLTAVSGVGLTWTLDRTSSVGTGGTTLTPRPMDSQNTSLPAQVTARVKPTGGAASSYTLLSPNTSSEETIPYASLASTLNHVSATTHLALQEIAIREGEGIRLVQTTNSSAGSTNTVIIFTVE